MLEVEGNTVRIDVIYSIRRILYHEAMPAVGEPSCATIETELGHQLYVHGDEAEKLKDHPLTKEN
jgi:hypothetical protein